MLFVTLREDPAEAEIPSHKLLLRAGYIRRIGSGVYAYLPLMWRVLRKISQIVREEMDAKGAQEALLPTLQPAELWRESGRWETYTKAEGIMFSLRDRQEREVGLGPTHEEVITAIARDMVRSYRQLPLNLYQIQTKFRDEIRPRFGLLRGREFIMKDAYSFDVDEAGMKESYAKMREAYHNILNRCGLGVSSSRCRFGRDRRVRFAGIHGANGSRRRRSALHRRRPVCRQRRKGNFAATGCRTFAIHQIRETSHTGNKYDRHALRFLQMFSHPNREKRSLPSCL
jgi:hypothetical protein